MPDDMGRLGAARPAPARLEDVAAAVGVSTSTVSRALRGHPAVKADTRRRIQAAANRLGYEPNTMASALRTQSSPFVGIVVPDITIPFFGLAVKAAQDVLEAAGYQVLIMNTHRDAERERRALRTLFSHRARGVLVATSGGFEQSGQMPAVFFANFDERLSLPRVALSNREGIRVLVEHLVLEHAHRRIAYVGGAPGVTSGSERASAFEATMLEKGLGRSMQLCLSDEQWSTASVEEELARALSGSEPPTAVVAGGDTFALGALKVLRRFAKRIPEDVALVTFQDPDRIGGVVEPALTTILTQERQLGQHAAALLLHTLTTQEGGGVGAEVRLPARLLVRRSCGCSSENVPTRFSSDTEGVSMQTLA